MSIVLGPEGQILDICLVQGYKAPVYCYTLHSINHDTERVFKFLAVAGSSVDGFDNLPIAHCIT